MSWAFTIIRISGIRVKIHVTLLLLLLWVALGALSTGAGVADAAGRLILLTVVFSVVVLHELGHALMARRFGIVTRQITLLPIGGVAELERMPEDPRQEILVALSGPLVNFVLAGLAYGALWLTPVESPTALLVGIFLQINLTLGLFNLLPAFPMDGGRVLRAVLAIGMSYARATDWAARVGQIIAILLGTVGLLGSYPILLFIALFVWVGASDEALSAHVRVALRHARVIDAMVTEFEILSPDQSLPSAVELLLTGFQHDFPVLEGTNLIGVLTREQLLQSLARPGADKTAVRQAMSSRPTTAAPGESLLDVIERLRTLSCETVVVMDGEHLVGLLPKSNVWELVMAREALSSGCPAREVGHKLSPD